MAAGQKAWGRVYRFLYGNKNRSEHLVKTSLSSEAPTDIKRWQTPPPTTTTATTSALMCKKPSTLFSVLSQAKTGPGREDETSSSLKGLCFISEDFVMTGRAGIGGEAKSRLGGNVYSAHKDCDNCSPFQLERHYTVFDSKKGLWKYNPDQRFFFLFY